MVAEIGQYEVNVSRVSLSSFKLIIAFNVDLVWLIFSNDIFSSFNVVSIGLLFQFLCYKKSYIKDLV